MVGVLTMTLTTLDVFNLISSITAIVLAVLAIVLSVVFYFASKNAEVKSTIALNDIQQATSTINNVSMKLLNRLTSYVTSPNPAEQQLIEVISNLKTVAPLTEEVSTSGATKAQLDQFRVDNLISSMFYAAVSNTSLQGYLPPDIGQLETVSVIARLVDQGKQDYFTLKSWIAAAGADKLDNSPVKHMYTEALTIEPGIKNTAEVYAARQNPTTSTIQS